MVSLKRESRSRTGQTDMQTENETDQKLTCIAKQISSVLIPIKSWWRRCGSRNANVLLQFRVFFFKDAFLWFLFDSAIFLQISIFLQNQKVREKTGLKMEEEKNVSKRWCANLIKSSFTSKKIKKVFDFFWLCSSFFEFFYYYEFLPLPD